LPAYENEGSLGDTISGLLTESGIYATNSLILDWQYIKRTVEIEVKAGKHPEEGEIFYRSRKVRRISPKFRLKENKS
jgi:hypothetical protein